MNKKDTLEFLKSLEGVQFTHEDTLNEKTKGLLSGRHKRNKNNPSEWIFEIKGIDDYTLRAVDMRTRFYTSVITGVKEGRY